MTDSITIIIKPEFSPTATLRCTRGEVVEERDIKPSSSVGRHTPRVAVLAAKAALAETSRDRSVPCDAPPEGTRWVRCYNPLRTAWQWKPIDVGVADLVEQLQRCTGGEWPLEPTVGSCAGHQSGDVPYVLLADGRVLAVFPGLDALDRLTPGGERPGEGESDG
jgi:hypothetical protein